MYRVCTLLTLKSEMIGAWIGDTYNEGKKRGKRCPVISPKALNKIEHVADQSICYFSWETCFKGNELTRHYILVFVRVQVHDTHMTDVFPEEYLHVLKIKHVLLFNEYNISDTIFKCRKNAT